MLMVDKFEVATKMRSSLLYLTSRFDATKLVTAVLGFREKKSV
jgi:hypothetical protein